MSQTGANPRLRSSRDHLPFAALVFALAVLMTAGTVERWALAVYALSFWHYLVYVLAFLWRRVSVQQLKRDALLLKTLSLFAFAFALWSTPPNPFALIVMIAGFALNISAARALGSDRTYYGFELGELPGKHITVFPFNLLSHPMLIGNMVAFGAPLLDESFRQQWWPLALVHVGLNFATLLVEVYGRPNHLAGALWPGIVLILGAILLITSFTDVWQFAVITVVMGFVFAAYVFRQYGRPSSETRAKERPS